MKYNRTIYRLALVGFIVLIILLVVLYFDRARAGTDPMFKPEILPHEVGEVAYVPMGDSDALESIDTQTHTTTGSLDMAQFGCDFPQRARLNMDGTELYVMCENSHNIVVLETTNLSLVATIDRTDDACTQDVTFVQFGAYALASSNPCSDGPLPIDVIDTETHTIVQSIPSDYPILSIAAHPYMALAYAACWDGGVCVINTNTFTVQSIIPYNGWVWDVQPSPDGQWVYASEYNGYGLAKIDVNTNMVVDTLPGYGKFGLDISPDSSTIYASEAWDSVVHIIDATNMELITTIDVGVITQENELTCDGSELYIAREAGSIPVVDTQTNSITYDIPISGTSSGFGIAVCPQYVAEDIIHWYYTGSLNDDRIAHTATLLQNGKVLVAGGNSNSGVLASAELYDPATGTWSRTGNMNSAHRHHTATLLPDGKVLLAGGDGISGVQASAELYDPDTGTWSYTGSMNDARSAHTATLLPNGKVLVAGGGYLDSAELFDPATGVWSYTGSLNISRDSHAATLLPNGKVLIAGGYHNDWGTTSAELYDPDTGTWSNTGSMNDKRAWPTVTLLPDGKVLVAGSAIFCSNLASAELYDPDTGTWSYTGSMNEGRGVHTSTLLSDGKILVAGGYVGCSPTSSAELYDPASGTWSNTGSMNDGRNWHTATLLPNGSVLAAGGGIGLATTELYFKGIFLDPTTQSKQGDRGQVVSYQETLSNYSGNSETFDLEALGNQWDTQLSTDQLGPLADGESASFTITVTVPVDAPWYSTDSTTILATGVSDPELTAEAVLTTTAFAPPQIDIDPNSLESTQFAGEVTTQTLTISNGEGVTLTYEIFEETHPGMLSGDVPWLSVDPVSGSVPSDGSISVQVTFDATDMEPGEYETTLFINSNDPQQPMISVPVTIVIPSYRTCLPVVFKK